MRETTVLRNVIALLGVLVCSAGVVLAQSQSQTNSQSQSQAPPQPAVQSSTQPGTQSGTPSGAQPEQKEESLADAARKARAKKAKSEPGKTYTDENISGLRSGGISVVGDGNSGGASSSETGNSVAESRANDGAKSGRDEEAYWRAKARQLLDAIAATETEIQKVKDEIAKYGNVGFDPSTGLQRNVIYVDDRNAHLKKLEARKAELEKQMDTLQEEGRKAGAEPSWFR